MVVPSSQSGLNVRVSMRTRLGVELGFGIDSAAFLVSGSGYEYASLKRACSSRVCRSAEH